MASVPFSFPDKSPTASTILQAVDASLLDIPNLSLVLRSKMRQYVRNIAAKDAVDPSSMIPPSRPARYDALETSVKQILQANGESADHVLRFKRPTGPITARAGNLLFYPPSSSPKTARDTLVMGPDTTERILAAGLSDAGLFTIDLYPFSTRIPTLQDRIVLPSWAAGLLSEGQMKVVDGL